MKIGLLGGSFDPIHKGHIEIASEAITSLALDSFYFIPTKNNPWKDNQNAPGASRKEMIEIAIHQDPKMKVCTIELDSTSDEKNYTINTIHALKKQNVKSCEVYQYEIHSPLQRPTHYLDITE